MKNFTIVVILCLMISSSFSQNIYDIVNNSNLNYFEKVNQVETNVNKGIEDPRAVKRYNRWRWHCDSRIDSEGSMESWIKAWRKITKIKNEILEEPDWTPDFKNVGPFDSKPNEQWNGLVRCLWVDPDDPDYKTILAGSDDGGLWKTTNQGINWVCITNKYPGMSVKNVGKC